MNIWKNQNKKFIKPYYQLLIYYVKFIFNYYEDILEEARKLLEDENTPEEIEIPNSQLPPINPKEVAKEFIHNYYSKD